MTAFHRCQTRRFFAKSRPPLLPKGELIFSPNPMRGLAKIVLVNCNNYYLKMAAEVATIVAEGLETT